MPRQLLVLEILKYKNPQKDFPSKKESARQAPLLVALLLPILYS
jgi:hypothetical protein